MFSDPNELSVRIDELDGAIVAMRKLADGGKITREMPDGRSVTRQPLLAQVLVFDGERAVAETTLVFPDSLKQAIEQAPGFVVGTLHKGEHPRRSDWSLWTIESLEEPVRSQAIEAFTSIAL